MNNKAEKLSLSDRFSFQRSGKVFNQESKALIFTIFNHHNEIKLKELKKISLQYPMKEKNFKKTLETLIKSKIIEKRKTDDN